MVFLLPDAGVLLVTLLIRLVISIPFITRLSFGLVVRSMSDEQCWLGLAKLKDVIGDYLCKFCTMEPLMFECVSRDHLLSEFLDCTKALSTANVIFFFFLK